MSSYPYLYALVAIIRLATLMIAIIVMRITVIIIILVIIMIRERHKPSCLYDVIRKIIYSNSGGKKRLET